MLSEYLHKDCMKALDLKTVFEKSAALNLKLCNIFNVQCLTDVTRLNFFEIARAAPGIPTG